MVTGTANGCAVRFMRTRQPPTASCRRRRWPPTTSAPGYDVLATTDHWHITEVAVHRAADRAPERGAQLRAPGHARRARARLRRPRHAGRAPRARRRLLEPRRDGPPGSRATAASRTSRTRTGRASRPGRSSCPDSVVGIEVFNAGCELEIGRGLSAVHWDELLEAGRLCPALATDDSHHPGFDSGSCADVGARDRADGGGRARGARNGRVLLLGRPAPARGAPRRRRRRGAVQPVPRGDARLGEVDRRRRQRRAARLPARRRDRRRGRRRAGRRGAARPCPPAARHVRVEVTDAAGRKAWANPIAV